MSQSIPSSVTIEEAVAKMVNMDYIPAGFTLLEMTNAFREEAVLKYEEAEDNGDPYEDIQALKLHMESCQARHSLANLLFRSLRYEVNHPLGSKIVIADDSSGPIRLTYKSVKYWAGDTFGIGWAPEKISNGCLSDGIAAPNSEARWEDITVKLYANQRIGYRIGNGKGKFKISTFANVGLTDKRKNEPNYQAGILINLAKKSTYRNKYPLRNNPANNETTAISKLRNSLKELTGISSDPFLPFNGNDGWIPRFELEDDRENADIRAKKLAEKNTYQLDEKTDPSVEADPECIAKNNVVEQWAKNK